MGKKMTKIETEKSSFYQRIFWLVTSVAITAVAGGVASFYTMQANMSNLTKLLDETRAEIKSYANNRYDAASASADRTSMMGLINTMQTSYADLLKEQNAINRLQTEQITSLMVEQAKLKPVAVTPR